MPAQLRKCYCNSLLCLLILILEIILKTISNCMIGSFFPRIRDMSHMQRTKMLWLHALSTRKNLVFHIKMMISKISEAVVRCCSAKKMFFKISQNYQEKPEDCNFIKKKTMNLSAFFETLLFYRTHLIGASVINSVTNSSAHNSLNDCYICFYTFFRLKNI